MNRKLLFMVSLLFFQPIPSGSLAQEIHSAHCLAGCPSGVSTFNDLIIRGSYVLSSNDTTKLADWVAYRVTSNTIGSTTNTRRTWKADPWLHETETLEPGDYKGANAVLHTDRGHQALLASFAGTTTWEQTNYLSNITPQKSTLNQGPWKHLEEAVRTLAKSQGVKAVYAVTGPLYERAMPSLPKADEPHRVPSGYWKIIAVQQGNQLRVAAFVLDQDTPRRESYCLPPHMVTVDEVEQRTRLDFFPAMTLAHQSEIEGELGKLFGSLGCS